MHTILSILGRLAFIGIFAGAAMNDLKQTDETVGMMTKVGVPKPDLMIYPAIAFLIAGSVMVGLGLFARFGAALLLVFLLLATYFFHNPMHASESEMMKTQIDMMKNVALMGMCLFVMGNGAGRGSIDAALFRKDA